ncbi:MAG: DUF6361 family protein [Luteolibacter sp.]
MSSIGWIDFSSEHREKVRTVIDLLSEPGVIDELGIGVVRNTFADRMFPGISTIQTRPKYFTLTALLLKRYQDVECSKRTPRPLERFLEEEERDCRIQLVEKHGEGRQNLGIIGGSFGTRRDQGVVRRPSSIYWFGLRAFGIISPRELSLVEFGRRLGDKSYLLRTLLEDRGDEKGDDHDAQSGDRTIGIRVPDVGKDYWEKLGIDLTHSEAEFLRHQITANQSDSLLGQILLNDERMDQVIKLDESAQFETFAELPFIKEIKSEDLRMTVSHARDFWRILEGAHIRYNCLLQEAGFGTEDLKEEFNEKWESWRERMVHFPKAWDSGFLWSLVARHRSQVKPATRRFIDGWIEQTRRGCVDLNRCNELVRNQELGNKGKRARLRMGNKESVSGWMGLNAAGYRLDVVRQMVRDIRDGEGDARA